ncbi:MAG: flagellar export chaperone FliS [Planctomycetota bacterium]
MVQNGHTEYMKTQILTASKERLVLMLFDGALRFCEQGKKGWAEDDLERAHTGMVRAQDILLELLYALDKEQGGKIADNLAQLYTFCYRHLVEANMEKSNEKVDEVIGVLHNLREAWSEAMDKAGAPEKADAAPAPQAEASTGAPLARIPLKKVPAATAQDGERPRISVQG